MPFNSMFINNFITKNGLEYVDDLIDDAGKLTSNALKTPTG